MRLATLLFFLPHLALALIRVPEDYPGIQAAMDASADDDTVLVDRGTWPGLLQSPIHSILLCSNYVISGDSTDIVETVLDGEYAGTILTVNTMGDEILTVTGFTMRRGFSRYPGGAFSSTGGAVRLVGSANACFTDIVFADNRGERASSILDMDNDGAAEGIGDLTLRRVHCVNNWVDVPQTNWSDAFVIRSRLGRLIVDGFRYDGGGLNMFVPDYVADSAIRKTLSGR